MDYEETGILPFKEAIYKLFSFKNDYGLQNQNVVIRKKRSNGEAAVFLGNPIRFQRDDATTSLAGIKFFQDGAPLGSLSVRKAEAIGEKVN